MDARRDAGNLWDAVMTASDNAVLPRAIPFFGYLAAVVLVTLVAGQKFALPLFVGIYLWRWGRYGWRLSVGYALGAWAFVVVFYDFTMHLVFHPFWLAAPLRSIIPDWLPTWLVV